MLTCVRWYLTSCVDLDLDLLGLRCLLCSSLQVKVTEVFYVLAKRIMGIM